MDEFGTTWKVTVEGRCGIPIEFPFSDYTKLDDYIWPTFSAGKPAYRIYSGHMTGTSEEYYARGGWITFFEQMQQLRKMLTFDCYCLGLSTEYPINPRNYLLFDNDPAKKLKSEAGKKIKPSMSHSSEQRPFRIFLLHVQLPLTTRLFVNYISINTPKSRLIQDAQ